MPESAPKEFHLLDYVDFIVKRKEMFIGIFILSFICTYLGVFVFIDEKFQGNAVLIPRSEESGSAVSSLLRSVKGVSFGLGGKTAKSETDLYTTVIYSRTMMEDMIRTFDLINDYGLDSTDKACMELAVKELRSNIGAAESDEGSFMVNVQAKSRQKAADMTNTLVRKMNERIVELNISRSRQNREFLERRVEEVRQSLRFAEDSLRAYQEQTGLLDAKTQVQGIIEAHATLEAELAARRIQRGIMEQMFDRESPQVREIEMQIGTYERRLREMRSRSDPGSPLLALKALPKTAVELVRRYREVEINSLLLEYIIPLHEQAKIEEKKDYPVLQVIDYAIPPAKKSYPPRTLFAFIGAVTVTFLVFLLLRTRRSLQHTSDERLIAILQGIRRWSWDSWKLKP